MIRSGCRLCEAILPVNLTMLKIHFWTIACMRCSSCGKGTKPVGRIAAFYDTLANDFWHEKVGLFGYYECPADASASKMLLQTAAEWLKEEGMTSMRGPWSFVSQEWGSVVEGFKPAPVVMSPYNPPYYNDQYSTFWINQSERPAGLLY